jgi:hypothetical protein
MKQAWKSRRKKIFFFIALQQKLPIVQPIARTEQLPCLQLPHSIYKHFQILFCTNPFLLFVNFVEKYYTQIHHSKIGSSSVTVACLHCQQFEPYQTLPRPMHGCDLQWDMDSSYQQYTQEESQCLVGCTTVPSLHTCLDQAVSSPSIFFASLCCSEEIRP